MVAYNVAGDGPASNAKAIVGISSVSTTNAGGAYPSGSITITIGFNGPVNVTLAGGALTLALTDSGQLLPRTRVAAARVP